MSKKCKLCGSKLSLTVRKDDKYKVVSSYLRCNKCQMDYKVSSSQFFDDKSIEGEYLPRK